MIEPTMRELLSQTIKVLFIYPDKSGYSGPVSLKGQNSSAIQLYKWNFGHGSLPREKFDFVLLSAQKPNKDLIRKVNDTLCNGAQALPVFSFFKRLSVRQALTLLNGKFSDVRIMPETPEKMANYIVTWSEYQQQNKLDTLRTNRISALTRKLADNEWFKKEIKAIHRELDQIKNHLDSYEIWHQRKGLDKELNLARSIQASFLPDKIPAFSNYDIEAICKPAKEVGGDFFDFCKINAHQLGFIIGDVATRGIPAALLMTEIRGMWRALIRNAPSPQFVVSQINDLLCKDLKDMWGMFVSLFCGILDSEKSEVQYTNAGHCYPVIFRPRDTKLIELKSGGRILGVTPHGYYQQESIPIRSKDILVCYTDGITEACSKEKTFFGKENLYQIVKKNSGHSVKYIKEAICKEVDSFTDFGTNKDDQALLIIKSRR